MLNDDDIEITITALPEDIPVRGNAMASGNDDLDKEVENRIIEDLDNGNEWAWCVVRVRASFEGIHSDSYLGGCSYASRAEFIGGGYFEQMRDEAIAELRAKVQNIVDKVKA